MTSHAAGIGATRARVLEFLQSAGRPLGVSEVAEHLHIHRNSARFHLDALVQIGYATKAAVSTGHRGRPPLEFSAAPDSPPLTNLHLVELAKVFFSRFVVGAPFSMQRSEQAGRDFGASLASNHGSHDPDEVIDELIERMRARGFGVSRSGCELDFIRCPFRDIIDEKDLPVIDAFHRGLIDGYLSARNTGLEVSRFEVTAQECHVTLRKSA